MKTDTTGLAGPAAEAREQRRVHRREQRPAGSAGPQEFQSMLDKASVDRQDLRGQGAAAPAWRLPYDPARFGNLPLEQLKALPKAQKQLMKAAAGYPPGTSFGPYDGSVLATPERRAGLSPEPMTRDPLAAAPGAPGPAELPAAGYSKPTGAVAYGTGAGWTAGTPHPAEGVFRQMLRDWTPDQLRSGLDERIGTEATLQSVYNARPTEELANVIALEKLQQQWIRDELSRRGSGVQGQPPGTVTSAPAPQPLTRPPAPQPMTRPIAPEPLTRPIAPAPSDGGSASGPPATSSDPLTRPAAPLG